MGRQLVLVDDGVDGLQGAHVDRLGLGERLAGADLVDRAGGRHHQRVAVVGAEVGHPAVDDDLHDLALAAEGRQRQPAADRLGQGDQVGGDAQALGRTGVAGGEAGLHLVEDEHDAVGVAGGADRGEVALVGHDDREVLDDRLDDQGGDLAAVLGEHPVELAEVVVGDHVHRAGLDVEGHLRGGRVGRADLVEPGLDRDLQRVVATVVAALDLHDRLALGVGPRTADGVHQRLGARVGEPDHVELEPVAEPLAHLGGLRRRRDEQGAGVGEGLGDLLDDVRVEVADEHRAEAHRQVEHAGCRRRR